MLIEIKCPKCDEKLKNKVDGFLVYPYCFECNTRYEVIISGERMEITIEEVE